MEYRDPTTAVKEAILARGTWRAGVQDVLAHQCEALASTEEAAEALATYILAQMYGDLRRLNPLLAAYEEARAASDIAWWRLLFDLGWSAAATEDTLPF